MDVERYMYNRERLVALYEYISNKTFHIFAPRQYFLSFDQIKQMEKHPPIMGLEMFGQVIERPITIARLCDMFLYMGENAGFSFRYPSKDIIPMYTNIQEYISTWCEVMGKLPWLERPKMQELEILEKIAKYIFGWYRQYQMQEINKSCGNSHNTELVLLDALTTTWRYGYDTREGPSFISHLSIFKEAEQGLYHEPSIVKGAPVTMDDMFSSSNPFGLGD
ncbi:putative SH2 domain containing protein [Aeromonas phage ZPAH34]|uniref:putative SH2 domain containing protein n=1 Tax=Aeromonas phage ZPAH34 TaxID=2924888 RepID=UPI0023292AB7|nr:putative SH2 domain containing protein [Aeromonas phage ZPAH34]UOX39595.1 putative SH2 domain containing protein [Aeromonas phage ZPAH34]